MAEECLNAESLGKAMNVDPTVVRVLWLIFSIMGAGILAYIICAIVMPDEPADAERDERDYPQQ